MLVLDPAHPPLWRSPTRLQFGAPAVAIVDDPEPWQERLVHELARGIPESALDPVAQACGAVRGRAAPFVERIRPALAAPARRHDARAAVHPGAGLTEPDVRSVVDALVSAGIRTRVVAGPPEPTARETVVLLAQHVVDPADARALLRADIPHLPLVFTGAGATVGPLVRPGETACLMCVEAQRCDVDPAWPALASQLLERTTPPAGRALALEAGLLAARFLIERDEPDHSAHSVTIYADSSRRSWRAHPPHPDCRCRSLGESATPIALDTPYRRVTRTPQASALPA
jgi:bacteriocin biosynthesis cyclodehydratase domain-containing protein